jgi:hypothetical protein
MDSLDDIRAELASRKPERSGASSTILAVLGAFAVGALAVFGWQFVPSAGPSIPERSISAARDAEVKIPATGDRLGQPANAPLLRTCMVPPVMGAGESSYSRPLGPRTSNPKNDRDEDFFPLDPVQSYAILKTLNTATRAAAVFKEPTAAGTSAQLSNMWGMMAECIFKKEAAELCDSNNRALGIEAVNNHVRHAEGALAQPNASASLQLSRLAALKERVIVEFRGHVRDGSVIAADVGSSAPAELRRIAQETKPVRNACAPGARSR